MRWSALHRVVIASLLLIGVSCTSSTEGSVTPSATHSLNNPLSTGTAPGETRGGAEATPRATRPSVSPVPAAPTPLAYDSGVRTGDSAVDEIVDALLSREWSRIEPIAQMSEVPCQRGATQLGAGPECPAGVEPGTRLKVFPVSQCERYWVAAEDLRVEFQNVVPDGSAIFAIGVAPPGQDGDFIVVFAIPATPSSTVAFAQSVTVVADRIQRVSYSCGQSPSARLESLGVPSYILPPFEP